MDTVEAVEAVGTAIEVAGVAVIVVGMVAATAVFFHRLVRRVPFAEVYRPYRQGLGRAILLGLEFLVAGDIIRTVAIEPTFGSVGVLAGIVLIRTFLSFSLEAELENRWPWQRRRTAAEPPSARERG
ncbi:DUF1622 domain-containing protein [Nocardiopsis sp. N85]|uniref:DUF1622 domain-containing protein n=1 Tax=Nocardiopsis sp. N85 TaxID=3029400 RepID=UPI00237F98B8|nr:DUF1622 domain-containing protein [Nocardiopsis sp. N85]MDE3722489.1 DUF1622 domain-containing protein [Nocardiopsis sp. N85]